MKTKILMSINPQYVKNILNGTKKYEYRKNAAKEKVSSIVIYETSPHKRVVAEVEIVDILAHSPDELWRRTYKDSGVSKEFFDKYFEEREIAYAYKLGKIDVFEKPKMLNEYGIKVAPQSFVYITSNC